MTSYKIFSIVEAEAWPQCATPHNIGQHGGHGSVNKVEQWTTGKK
jgi:hypothetical protein